MRSDTLELYKKNCRFERNCNPEPKIKSYPSGVKHYVTQCATCGGSFGQAFSKKLLEPSISVEPFDENFEKKYYEEAYKEFFIFSENQKKLQNIKKRLKADYFKNVLHLPFDNFETAYKAYLNSEYWQIKRNGILKRDDYLCQFCKLSKATQVHHLSYDNLGNESDFELLSVCHNCHQIIHNFQNDENMYDQRQKKEL